MLVESVRHGMLKDTAGEKNPLRGAREHASRHRTPEHAPWHRTALERGISVRHGMLGAAWPMTSAQRKRVGPEGPTLNVW